MWGFVLSNATARIWLRNGEYDGNEAVGSRVAPLCRNLTTLLKSVAQTTVGSVGCTTILPRPGPLTCNLDAPPSADRNSPSAPFAYTTSGDEGATATSSKRPGRRPGERAQVRPPSVLLKMPENPTAA